MAKIAFISCLWRKRFTEELGVCYLKTVLQSVGHEVEIFYKYPDDEVDVFDEVVKFNPKLVGFSLSHKHTGIKPLAVGAEILMDKLDNPYIFAGGVFASFNAKNMLEKSPKLGAVMIGEGECSIVDLVNAALEKESFENVDGLIYREGNVIKENLKTKYIHNLDSIQFPNRDYIKKYITSSIKSVNIVGSRGCHGKCHFCNVPTMYSTQGDLRWRGRSVKNIVDEIEYLHKNYDIMIFNFGDSSMEDSTPLSQGKERLKNLAQEILGRGLKIFYSCCFRAETFKDTPKDNELISLLVKSGLYNILIGVEAGNKKALNSFSKRADVCDNLESIDLFSKYPIYISKGFMMFTPQSQYEDLKNNLDFAHSINLTEELIYLTTITSVFDGTPFVTDLQKAGLLEDNYDWEAEYPFSWSNDDVGKLASKMLEIRDECMEDLEFSQYYGRSDILLERMLDGRHPEVLAYRKWKIKSLREEMANNSYKFFDKCFDLIGSWNEEEYSKLKKLYIIEKFQKIIYEMKLESKKFSRLLKQKNILIEEIINTYRRNDL